MNAFDYIHPSIAQGCMSIFIKSIDELEKSNLIDGEQAKIINFYLGTIHSFIQKRIIHAEDYEKFSFILHYDLFPEMTNFEKILFAKNAWFALVSSLEKLELDADEIKIVVDIDYEFEDYVFNEELETEDYNKWQMKQKKPAVFYEHNELIESWIVKYNLD